MLEMTMRPHLDLHDPRRRTGAGLVAAGVAVSIALAIGQGSVPPAALLGFGHANIASGFLFVMAGGVLLARNDSFAPIGATRLARLFTALGLAALAAPALLHPLFPGV